MASAFARSARHSFRAGSAAFRSSTRRPSPANATSRHLLQNKVPQRRFLQSVIPLHNAVASAKLVSHLSTSSRSRSALSLGKLSSILRPPLSLPTSNKKFGAFTCDCM
eukprot:TRINITY_DN206_c0_g1_i1.p1 TRINITY_DN206_c0_g1~~TRINITY_DN206_c0_g1_i1.p1  ORF type:complete len:124 (-),score=1.60 TRINITY_DN206_c0_g1_i1:535-858(-)